MEQKIKENDFSFPLSGIVPKDETQALEFLSRDQRFDGRGVLVGILDTGVDPSAAGLQKSTAGSKKITHIIDCTGDGDVDMKMCVEMNMDSKEIKLASGRILVIPEEWSKQNPSGSYRVGLKSGYELFPKPLISRLNKEKKSKYWDIKNSELYSQIQSQMAKESDEFKDELKERLSALTTLADKHEEVGPVYDCILFQVDHTSESQWRIALVEFEPGSTKLSGDHLKLLKPYGLYPDVQLEEWSYFSKEDLLSFSFNVYADGDILSIVTNGGSHGTHVAGILGANYEDEALNGIAPGCQIVSFKIGDRRLGQWRQALQLFEHFVRQYVLIAMSSI